MCDRVLPFEDNIELTNGMRLTMMEFAHWCDAVPTIENIGKCPKRGDNC
jgi:hypothetical protein